jgi:hypothetical protein
MNYEADIYGTKLAQFTVLSIPAPGWTEKNHEIFGRITGLRSRIPEYETGELTTGLRINVALSSVPVRKLTLI